jgi:glycerol kinase
VGFWSSIEEISSQWKVSGQFVPAMDEAEKNSHINNWQRAVKAVLAWSAPNN